MLTLQLLAQPKALLLVRLALSSKLIHLGHPKAPLHGLEFAVKLLYLLRLLPDSTFVAADCELQSLIVLVTLN